jgi:hypothetical protein
MEFMDPVATRWTFGNLIMQPRHIPPIPAMLLVHMPARVISAPVLGSAIKLVVTLIRIAWGTKDSMDQIVPILLTPRVRLLSLLNSIQPITLLLVLCPLFLEFIFRMALSLLIRQYILRTWKSRLQSMTNTELATFGGSGAFQRQGGMAQIGDALGRGMVLVFSIWMDHGESGMLWLDGTFPLTSNGTELGSVRGPCGQTSGNNTMITNTYPDAKVVFSAIKVGELGSTFGHVSQGNDSIWLIQGR